MISRILNKIIGKKENEPKLYEGLTLSDDTYIDDEGRVLFIGTYIDEEGEVRKTKAQLETERMDLTHDL